MKSWVFAAFLISVCALAACDDGETGLGNTSGSGATGGDGGSGSTSGTGGGTGGGSDGGGSGEGGAGASTSTSSGPPTCEESSDSCGRDTNSGCYRCAADGPCKEVIAACVNDESDTGCFYLMACIYECSKDADPAACEAECRTKYTDGEEAYNAIIRCTICDECAESCGASEEPMCQQ